MNANQSDTEQDACEIPINITARVVAISNTAIIVADTANPLPTISDAQYQAFATTFDTLINPLDTQAFGQPTDIDGNGRILIFFTKEVNKLTPKTGRRRRRRGLLPTARSVPDHDPADPVDACPTSNVGEMFYVFAPDTNGVYSVPHTTADVLGDTPGILAHEYQHLINAARRLYINDAQSFEEVWLNEGLSHIAEELLYYRESGNTPRENIGVAIVGATQAAQDVFFNDQGANFGRYQAFLSMPSQTSVLRRQRQSRNSWRDLESVALSRRPPRHGRRHDLVAAREHHVHRAGQSPKRVRRRLPDSDSRLGNVRVRGRLCRA